GTLNVERRGVPKLTAYWSDLFHTLINIPNVRFYPLLLLGYSLLFGGFAVPYYYQSVQYNCIPGVKNYWHALWFSVQSAMTIGFGGDLVPDPNCFTLNLLIALQSLAALIVAYALLGIVYTRFALPSRRASSLVFSQCMVLNEEDGVPRLSFRVANVRKHQLIEAHAQLLVAINNIMSAENEALFKFSNLPILGGGFVFLALPCIITHAITKHSPLHGMSLAMMERADIEFLVLIEGVDAPTSAKLQARHSYSPCDIKFNHRFSTMVRRSPSGIRRVDFTKFHDVQPVPATLRRPHFLPHAPSWENLRNLSSLSSLPGVLRHPTAVSTDKSGAIMGRRDAPHPFPGPADSASASQASLAYPPVISAAGGGSGGDPAPVAADTIRKNSSFMNILSLGFGPGSGVWNAAHVGTWSMEATAEAAVSGAVVLAPVAVAATSTAVIAGGGDAAVTVGTAAGSASQAPAFEGRKQMRRMIAVAEKREQQWRSLVVDLAIKPLKPCRSSCVAPATILSEVTKSNVDSIPVLSQTEVAERLAGHKHPNQRNYRAFYSSVVGGITTDPAAMVLPIDDHMAHRGHAVFDTAIICSGYLYELDEHVDRFIKSARAARIEHSYSREELKAIIIQTVAGQ
ncbi:unnamed protein product, partial [Closterium sp. NIES-65]